MVSFWLWELRGFPRSQGLDRVFGMTAFWLMLTLQVFEAAARERRRLCRFLFLQVQEQE